MALMYGIFIVVTECTVCVGAEGGGGMQEVLVFTKHCTAPGD